MGIPPRHTASVPAASCSLHLLNSQPTQLPELGSVSLPQRRVAVETGWNPALMERVSPSIADTY